MPGGVDQGGLPSHLQPVFWDTTLDDIDPDVHEAFVIERVLEYGDAESIRWLWQRYGRQAIRDVVQTSRRLSARTLSLWSRHLGLGEADAWRTDRRPSQATSWRH